MPVDPTAAPEPGRLRRHWPVVSALGSRRGHPLPLATADEIVLQQAELLQVLADVRKRNKGGRS